MKKTCSLGITTLVCAGMLGMGQLPVFADQSATTLQTTPVQLTVGGTTLPSGTPKSPSGTTDNPLPSNTQFGLLFVPSTFDFGSTPENFMLGNTLTMPISGDHYVGVGDTRDTKPGWQLTAQASALKNGDNTLTGTISMKVGVKSVSFDGGSYSISGDPTSDAQAPQISQSNVQLTAGGDATAVLNAKAGTGQGMWAADLSAIQLSATQTSQLTKGSYTGTITWNLGNAPK